MKLRILGCFCLLFSSFLGVMAQNPPKTVFSEDLEWTADSPAGSIELQIPSHGSLLQGMMYKANSKKLHPLLILLHGYPGNERNLDLAQAVRAHGWNVVYFNYRGSWGSQGMFSFRNCVEDVASVLAYCKTNAGKLEIDTNQIAVFGHSMGGFVCLKALQTIPSLKKGFALSTWDIFNDVKKSTAAHTMAAKEKEADNYFVLNKLSGKALYEDVSKDPAFFNLENAAGALAGKELVMLDEHPFNEATANLFKKTNHNYFDYAVWKTDHPFTNKRISLIKRVINFLDR